MIMVQKMTYVAFSLHDGEYYPCETWTSFDLGKR